MLDEIQRPVFARLDKGPLANSCTFRSYDALEELKRQDHLAHMSDSVLEEYEEAASDLRKDRKELQIWQFWLGKEDAADCAGDYRA